MNKKTVCPQCGSSHIFNFRINNDLGWGTGDYTIVNDLENYTEEELKCDSFDRADIDLFCCESCGNQW